MSDRRWRLLRLMAQRENQELGVASARLADLRSREMQQYDLIDRLDTLLAHSDLPDHRAISRGDLFTSRFLQQAMVAQRDTALGDLQRLHSACQTQLATMGRHQQRKTVLDDQAKAAERAAAETKAAAAEAAAQRPKPR